MRIVHIHKLFVSVNGSGRNYSLTTTKTEVMTGLEVTKSHSALQNLFPILVFALTVFQRGP